MPDFATPTECMIAAMEEMDDCSAVLILMRYKDGSFAYFVPSEQHMVDSIGMTALADTTLRWEITKNMEVEE